MRSVIFGAVLSVMLVGGALGQAADIKGTISSQIEAFKSDDFATAFGFASPGIRSIFRTPENFGRMVTQGFPMVWRPAEVEFLGLADEGGVLRQRVRIVDGRGMVHVLDYFMIETGEGWRINGVEFVPQPDVST